MHDDPHSYFNDSRTGLWLVALGLAPPPPADEEILPPTQLDLPLGSKMVLEPKDRP